MMRRRRFMQLVVAAGGAGAIGLTGEARAMTARYAELLDRNALYLLAWRYIWPPSHGGERLGQQEPLAGPWSKDVARPEPASPMRVSGEQAADMMARAPLLGPGYLTEDADELRKQLVQFLTLAFPDQFASSDEAEALVADSFAAAREHGFGEPDVAIYWPVLVVLGGADFAGRHHVSLWLQIAGLRKSDRLEMLIQGANVTLRNPWLAVLTNSYESLEVYDDGTTIREDGLGRERIR